MQHLSNIQQDLRVEKAVTAFEDGNVAYAYGVCRELLAADVQRTDIYHLLARIAMKIHLPVHALKYCDKALSLDPSFKGVLKIRRKAQELLASQPETALSVGDKSAQQHTGFLFIKAWGFGFWSDMDHVLGQLLLAEITGRSPVVHWGKNSMFRDANSPNGFTDYYEPVSCYEPIDLVRPEYSYFPPKWNHGNLLQPELNKWAGPYSRCSGILGLNRSEDVIVSDFHTFLNDLIPWIPDDHPLRGYEPEDVYRKLFTKYLHLKPDLQAQVDLFEKDNFKGKKMLAVHVRGSDKIKESPDLHAIYEGYFPILDKYLGVGLATHLFLLTDSLPMMESYKKRYGDRVITTSCRRSGSFLGVHYQRIPERSELAKEVILDTYLAAKCDYFIGLGDSNVSVAVLHLKRWPEGAVTLLGRDNVLYKPQAFLFEY